MAWPALFRLVKRTVLSLALLAFASALSLAQQPVPQDTPGYRETPEQFAKRTQWWREAKFGMFIHWGIYAVPADSSQGIAEWYFSNHTSPNGEHLQVRDYEKFAGQFNPVRFDARKWVQAAKNAGMKYIVITSKHHDGFCMFDSKLTDYTIVKATPYKRDPMKALAAECRRQGIKLCFYHSIMDWHHPDYLPRRPWEGANRPAEGASLDRYIEYMKGQLRELLTNYGPIGILWFDGGWEHNADELHSQEVNALIRSLQPNILINDRNHLPEDYSTPEQTIPANALPGGRLWETCMTMNDTWGYSRNDHNFKSAEDLIHKLCDIASKGGNFLLNVGPTELGEFPPESLDRLARIGQWMRVNSESIYGTTKSPFRKLPFEGRCTQKGNTLYLQVFHWPENGLILPGLKTGVKEARALDGRERLSFSLLHENPGFAISKPSRLDPVATVIKLELAGPPEVEEIASSIAPNRDGSFTLSAADATIRGTAAQLETKDNIPNIGFWTDSNDTVEWTLAVPKAGDYTVEINYACTPENAGSTYRVQVEGAQAGVEGTVLSTGDWAAFRSESLPGTVRLSVGGQIVRVKPLSMPHGAVMNLRSLTLKPAP
ncbi:MAG TPA: alpha-L-fucosidase [Chthonomonadaceae bacterium]|nr:alpha-L-fucosidase [Chthonomonadaceae bacterium]